MLAEVDVGLGRVGVPPGESLLQLIQRNREASGLRFDGIAFYPGQIKSLDEEGERRCKAWRKCWSGILSDLRRAGFEAENRQRRIHAHAVPFAPLAGAERDSAGHLYF